MIKMMRNFIALYGLRELGMKLMYLRDSLKSPMKYPKIFSGVLKIIKPMLFKSTFPLKSEKLSLEKIKLEKALLKFNRGIIHILARYKDEVLDEQLALNRVATTVICLYTVTAVLSRLDSVLQKSDLKDEDISRDLAVGKLYCQMAFDKIDTNLKGLKYHFNKEIEAVSQKLTGI